MKRRLQMLLENAVRTCIDKKLIDVDAVPYIEIDVPKDAAHGDYASNVAMVLASRAKEKLPPRRIADLVLKNI
ncbi:MAG TPA: arginine--tRNA ligase, partial [Syntrophales bacterium]|nr:arginine--tRNA ligase [Syntrophales bacterium]